MKKSKRDRKDLNRAKSNRIKRIELTVISSLSLSLSLSLSFSLFFSLFFSLSLSLSLSHSHSLSLSLSLHNHRYYAAPTMHHAILMEAEQRVAGQVGQKDSQFDLRLYHFNFISKSIPIAISFLVLSLSLPL